METRVSSDTTFTEVRKKWIAKRKGMNTASVETGPFFVLRPLDAAFWHASMYISRTITRIVERIVSRALLECSKY
jgi:hypothetical protein